MKKQIIEQWGMLLLSDKAKMNLTKKIEKTIDECQLRG